MTMTAVHNIQRQGRSSMSTTRLPRIGLIHGAPALLAIALAAFGTGMSAIPVLVLLIGIGLVAILLGEYVRAGQ